MENIQPFDKAASTRTVTINTQNAQRVTLPDQTAFPSTELMTFGLSKREYFAAIAMNQFIQRKWSYETIAQESVLQADELIKALNV